MARYLSAISGTIFLFIPGLFYTSFYQTWCGTNSFSNMFSPRSDLRNCLDQVKLFCNLSNQRARTLTLCGDLFHFGPANFDLEFCSRMCPPLCALCFMRIKPVPKQSLLKLKSAKYPCIRLGLQCIQTRALAGVVDIIQECTKWSI